MANESRAEEKKLALEQINKLFRSLTPESPNKPTPIHNLDPITKEDVADRQSDRGLKKLYALWFIGILIGQLLILNGIFIAYGLQALVFDESTLKLFMGGTLAEIFGVVLVITKYLFRSK